MEGGEGSRAPQNKPITSEAMMMWSSVDQMSKPEVGPVCDDQAEQCDGDQGDVGLDLCMKAYDEISMGTAWSNVKDEVSVTNTHTQWKSSLTRPS